MAFQSTFTRRLTAFVSKPSRQNSVGTLDLSDAPFEIVLIDAKAGTLTLFEKQSTEYYQFSASKFVARYDSYLKRKLNNNNVPVRVTIVKEGSVLFTNHCLGGYSKEEIFFAPWDRFHHHDSQPAFENAMAQVGERGAAAMLTNWKTKSGHFTLPIKSLIIRASGGIVVFSSVMEEPTSQLNEFFNFAASGCELDWLS